MKRYKENYELKNSAKDTLDGKYGGAVLIIFLSALISQTARFFISSIAVTTMNTVYYSTGSESVSTAISFVFDLILLAANVVLGVMNAGITLYFLKIACGQPYAVRDLFYGFRTDSSKILTIEGAMVLCQTIFLWPCQYLAQQYLSTQDEKWLFYALAAMLIGFCIYIPSSLGIGMSFYLMLDFPEYSAREVLSICWRLMKGQRGRLFFLELSFLPLILLCILSFGIGFLWLNPYMQMTYTCFFLDLMNPREPRQQ